MFVILTHDVPGVGNKHELLNVKRGYYSNFLAPRRFAKVATEHLLNDLKNKLLTKKALEATESSKLAEELKKISGKKLSVSAKSSAKGNLFRALGVKAVLDVIKAEHGIELSKTDVEMQPVKTIGEHALKLKVKGQEVTVPLLVEAKKDE